MAKEKKEKKKGRPDGLKRVSFTLDGKRYYCYGHTLAEARERVPERKAQIKQKRIKKAKDMTFAEYYAQWAAAREGVVKPATIRKQESQFNTASGVPLDMLGTTIGNIQLTEIETQHIKILQKRLLVGLKSDKSGNESVIDRSPQTVNDTIALISHVLRDAVNERVIDWNPCTGIKPLKRINKPARETIHRALTREETRLFFEAAQGSAYIQLYKFLINSGCRIGEAAALTVGDIKLDHIQIQRTVTKGTFGYEIGETTKTPSSKRTIPLTPEIREALDRQRAINAAIYGEDLINLNDTVFKTGWGNLLLAANVDRDIRRICEKAGIPRFTAHAFRDTFATRALESGMNPKTLQVILGHSDFSMTMNLYAHVMDDTKAEEMRKIKTMV